MSDRKRSITLKDFSYKRIDGIITNTVYELSDQQMENIAESILQVLYNLGTYSNLELSYDLEVHDGTKYFVHGTDVTVLPVNHDAYTRRIRNNRDIIRKNDDPLA